MKVQEVVVEVQEESLLLVIGFGVEKLVVV